MATYAKRREPLVPDYQDGLEREVDRKAAKQARIKARKRARVVRKREERQQQRNTCH